MMKNFRTKDPRPPTVTLGPDEDQSFIVNGVRFDFVLRESGIKNILDITIRACDGYTIYRLGENIQLTLDAK